MIRHRVPFYQFHPFLLTQLSQDLSYAFSQCPKNYLLPIFRNKNNMVSAVPFNVGEVLPLSHDGLLSREPARSRLGDRLIFHVGTAEPFRVSPP